MDYGAIVVGAGHNGLICATYLQLAGISTLVVEARDSVGGCASTVDALGGARVNICNCDHTMVRATSIIDELNLTKHGLRYLDVDPAYLSVHWAHTSTHLSFTREFSFDLGQWGWIAMAIAMVMATTNAANLTDGLDGLLSGTSILVFGVYAIIAFWLFRHYGSFVSARGTAVYPYTIEPAQALDLSAVAAAFVGACTGFLWWNAAPARVFMGDTGSMAIGAGMAGMALMTNTQLLLPIVAGLCVVETLSVILQVISFRGFGRRILRMSPIHHHFELLGWPETTITVRFWIFAGMCSALGLGLFYADFLSIPSVTN